MQNFKGYNFTPDLIPGDITGFEMWGTRNQGRAGYMYRARAHSIYYLLMKLIVHLQRYKGLFSRRCGKNK